MVIERCFVCLLLILSSAHSLAQTPTQIQTQKDACTKGYAKINSILNQQDQSQIKRLETGIKLSQNTPKVQEMGFSGNDFGKATLSLAVGGGIPLLASYLYRTNLRNKLIEKALPVFSNYFGVPGAEIALKTAEREALLTTRNDVMGELGFQQSNLSMLIRTGGSGQASLEKEISGLKDYMTELDEGIAEIENGPGKKIMYDIYRDVSDLNVTEETVDALGTTTAADATAGAEMNGLMYQATKATSFDNLIGKLEVGAMFIGVTIALIVVEHVSEGKRVAPERAWGDAVTEKPELITNPLAMEQLGILQGSEKGHSVDIACRAIAEYPDEMFAAAKSLANQHEIRFQFDLSKMLDLKNTCAPSYVDGIEIKSALHELSCMPAWAKSS